MQFTYVQKVIAKSYLEGEYAWLADETEVSQSTIDDLGDRVFAYLLRECGPSEDCEGVEDALRRVDNIIDDLFQVRNGLENANDGSDDALSSESAPEEPELATAQV